MSPGKKKAIAIFVGLFLIWQFWTDPAGLGDNVRAVVGGVGMAWERFTIFMGALSQQ